MEKGAAPARPMLPVISARLLMAVTVTAPWVEWLTPMVQPMKAALALAVQRRDALDLLNAETCDLRRRAAGVNLQTKTLSSSKPVVCASM